MKFLLGVALLTLLVATTAFADGEDPIAPESADATSQVGDLGSDPEMLKMREEIARIPLSGKVKDIPYFWGDVSYATCKKYESENYRTSKKQKGDLPVIEDHLKGVCGTLQELVESFLEFKQALAYRDNKTTLLVLESHSSKPEIERWGRWNLLKFTEWLFKSSRGTEDIQNLRFSINNMFKDWFNAVIAGEIAMPPQEEPAHPQVDEAVSGDSVGSHLDEL